jgi:hypothetical protein
VIIPLPEPREGEIAFSRIVRATVGQLVEIPFRGTGWVYLGELGSRRGIVYDSRRLDPEGQSFVFRIEAAGTYALKFFKQDFIRDFILNDHVQVLAGEAPDSAGAGWFNQPLERGRVRAEPRWPSSLEEAERIRRGTPTAAGTASAANTQAGESPAGTAGTAGIAGIGPGAAPPAQTAAAAPERPVVTERPAVTETGSARAPVPVSEAPADMTAPGFLQKARDEFEAGRIASAISLLDQLRERYPSGSDEAYWLYGQFYEANSPSRDILTALDYYRRLVREYPQSGRFNDARRRIAYLERYYIFNN